MKELFCGTLFTASLASKGRKRGLKSGLKGQTGQKDQTGLHDDPFTFSRVHIRDSRSSYTGLSPLAFRTVDDTQSLGIID